jgi:hypothetical protein
MNTIEQKRQILDSCKGQFFHVKWFKKDGVLREATCKHMVVAQFSSGDKNDVQINPCTSVNHKMYSANDVNKTKTTGKDGWVHINLETLFELRVNGKTYNF